MVVAILSWLSSVLDKRFFLIYLCDVNQSQALFDILILLLSHGSDLASDFDTLIHYLLFLNRQKMIDYSVYMQPNPMDETAAPKAYAKAQMRELMDSSKFINHIAAHNGGFSRGTLKGVISDVCTCIVEQLLEGKKVELGDLGYFWISLNSTGANTMEEFTASRIKSVNIIFTPGEDFENLIGKAEFNLVPSRVAQAATLKTEKAGGDTVDLAAAKAAARANSSSGSTGSGSTDSGNSSGESGNGSITTETLAAPVLSGSTPFTESTSVTITGPSGAQIRYTTDGSTPTSESTLYSEAITLSDTATVKAIAIKDGTSSEVASKTFTKTDGGGGNGADAN